MSCREIKGRQKERTQYLGDTKLFINIFFRRLSFGDLFRKEMSLPQSLLKPNAMWEMCTSYFCDNHGINVHSKLTNRTKSFMRALRKHSIILSNIPG